MRNCLSVVLECLFLLCFSDDYVQALLANRSERQPLSNITTIFTQLVNVCRALSHSINQLKRASSPVCTDAIALGRNGECSIEPLLYSFMHSKHWSSLPRRIRPTCSMNSQPKASSHTRSNSSKPFSLAPKVRTFLAVVSCIATVPSHWA